jgi:hypothetical protein
MRKPAMILAIMVATLLMAPASPQDRVSSPHKDKTEESAKKIKEFQRERIATLKQLVDETSKLRETRAVAYEAVVEAKLLLLNAELDAAEKESSRITVYKSIVDVLKEGEEFAENAVKVGGGPPVRIFKVRAMRLEAEINLERAKAKEAQEPK